MKIENNKTDDLIKENKPIITEEINHIIEEAIKSINNNEIENVPVEEILTTNGSLMANSQEEESGQPLEVIEKELNKYFEKDEIIQGNIEKNVPIGEIQIDNKKETATQEITTKSNCELKNISPTENYENPREDFDESVDKIVSPPLLNLNAKSSSEDSGSSVLSNQGSVIDLNTKKVNNENEEEEDEEVEEVSEEESEYEEEEVEVTDDEELQNVEHERESPRNQLGEIQNVGAGLVNGAVSHNGGAEVLMF